MKSELIQEEWRPVRGYESLYDASNFGRIRSLKFSQSHVSACCRGERKTHNGVTFRYKEKTYSL